MTRQELFEYINKAYEIKADYPFSDGNETAVFRHTHNRKWFGILMSIPKSRLGIDSNEVTDVLNIKCDPLIKGNLNSDGGFYPAYHMNKEKWISVLLRDVRDEENLKWLINISFELTK
ncbi:MAG: MmcQ/YjbR family DNA-binding protein [Clostridia bacterium]|nr:MmcQ/YjbR family DNA-binding protein [Clostridia bacterium]